jgi:enamine deaminase RidA (YjgF/YER057c/UK114 family)
VSRPAERPRVAARRPWAAVVGYARAVRCGSVIEVGGTTSVDEDGNVLYPGDPYAQAKECLRVIGEALRELGASQTDVVRTRVFLRDIADWERVGRAHGEVYGAIEPSSSFVGGLAFLDPRILVEIEATAIVD